MSDLLKNLNKNLAKIHPYGNIMNDPDYGKITDWIDTGNLILNMGISGSFTKGIPNNKIVGLIGDSQTGKTFLLLNIFKNALRKNGYSIYHFDTEGAIGEDELDNFGMTEYWDTDEHPSEHSNFLKLIPIGKTSDFKHMVTNIIEEMLACYKTGKPLPKVMISCDSIGNLATEKEYSDARDGKQKADMTAAKDMKSFFRIITVPCNALKIPFLFINHVYASTDMFSPQANMSKGTGPEYAASILIELSKSKLKEGDQLDNNADSKEQIGIKVTAKMRKNRMVSPHPVKFHIRYTEGMNRFSGLERYIKGLNPSTDNGDEFLGWDEIGIAKGKVDDKGVYTELKKGGKVCVKHLRRTVTAKEFFSPIVFNDELIAQFDRHMAPKFELSKTDSDGNLIDQFCEE
jgi:RecA/RadA recombinase